MQYWKYGYHEVSRLVDTEALSWGPEKIRQEWQCICSCGEMFFLHNKTMQEAADEMAYIHPQHQKRFFCKMGAQRHFCGNLPKMQDEDGQGRE